jgi:hypothetical protein
MTLGDARVEQLPNENCGQRLVEVKGALGLVVALDAVGQCPERRAAER